MAMLCHHCWHSRRRWDIPRDQRGWRRGRERRPVCLSAVRAHRSGDGSRLQHLFIHASRPAPRRGIHSHLADFRQLLHRFRRHVDEAGGFCGRHLVYVHQFWGVYEFLHSRAGFKNLGYHCAACVLRYQRSVDQTLRPCSDRHVVCAYCQHSSSCHPRTCSR